MTAFCLITFSKTLAFVLIISFLVVLWKIIFHQPSTNFFYRIHLFLFVCIHFIYQNLFLFMIICKNLFLFVIICENLFLFMIICENLFLTITICQNLFLFVKTYFHLWECLFLYDHFSKSLWWSVRIYFFKSLWK